MAARNDEDRRLRAALEELDPEQLHWLAFSIESYMELASLKVLINFPQNPTWMPTWEEISSSNVKEK